jgi:hypothetical protein
MERMRTVPTRLHIEVVCAAELLAKEALGGLLDV